MNKTALFVTFCILVALAIVGSVVLMIVGIDPGPFIGQVVTLLGLVSVAAGTFYSLGKQGDKLNNIEANTNGRLTARDNEIKRLTNIIVGMGIDPNNVNTATLATIGQNAGNHVSS